MFRKLAPYIKKYKIYAILSPIMMILEVASDIVIPVLMAKIVDVGIAGADGQYVIRMGLIMIALALFGGVMGTWSSHIGAMAGFGTAAEIRKAAYASIQQYSFANIDKLSAPSLITRLTTDAEQVGQVTMMSLRMAIRAPFLMIFALIMALYINGRLALIFFGAIPALALALVVILRKAMPLFQLMQEKIDRVNAVVQEQLAGIRVIKSFNRQKESEDAFMERNQDLRDTAIRAINLIVAIMPVMFLVVYICIIFVLWFGGKMVMAGTMGSGDLIAFITYISQIMMALMMLSMYFMMYTRASASTNRLIEVIHTKSEIQEPDNPVQEVRDGSIVFENVSFKYPGYRENILKNIHLTLQAGEVIGIIGSTGSSKSTLVQMIPRLYDVDEGSVKVGGVDVRNYSLVALREAIGFVLQNNTLVSGTIRSNMQWGDEQVTDEKIIEALRQAQAWEFVSQYEDGLDHRVEQGGNNFSGGQKQRLTIARALIKQPKILILDDSTSAVDMTTDAKLRQTFRAELKGVTTIIIAQRVASIRDADQIIVMEEGRVDAKGTHGELLEKSEVYREIFDSQQKGLAVS